MRVKEWKTKFHIATGFFMFAILCHFHSPRHLKMARHLDVREI